MYGFKLFSAPKSIISNSKGNSSNCCYFEAYDRMLWYVLTFKWNLFTNSFTRCFYSLSKVEIEPIKGLGLL